MRARAWVRFDWQNEWGRVAFRRLGQRYHTYLAIRRRGTVGARTFTGSRSRRTNKAAEREKAAAAQPPRRRLHARETDRCTANHPCFGETKIYRPVPSRQHER